MKQKIAVIIIAALAIILTGSCNRRPHNLMTWYWECITPESDSLMAEIEWAFYNNRDKRYSDSLIVELGAMAQKATGETRDALMTRWHFWRASSMMNTTFSSNNNAHAELELARQTADSLRRPHEYRRIHSREIHLKQSEGNFRLKEIIGDYEFYLAAGDNNMAGAMAMVAASALGDAGDTDNSIHWFVIGDSLYKETGMERSRAIYQINYATILGIAGRREEAEELFRKLLTDSTIIYSSAEYNVLLCNTYNLTRDPAYLHRAYEAIRNSPNGESFAGLYEARLALYHLRSESLDSAVIYLERARRRLPAMTNLYNRSEVYDITADIEHALGRHEMAYDDLQRSIELYDSAEASNNKKLSLKVQADHELKMIEMEKLDEKRKGQFRLLLALLCAVSVAGVLAIIWQRHRRHYDIERERARLQLEYERRRREVAALTVEETECLATAVMNEMNSMSDAGTISEADRRKVASIVRRHTGRLRELDNVSHVFEKTCPNFADNLRRACPDIAETQVRLAGYILIGMSNKEIAGFLNIRPESVRQSRWRLKARLGIDSDTTLEEALRKFNTPD